MEEEREMGKVLTKDEAFDLLHAKFKNLKPWEIIELCHDGRRFPAIVTGISWEDKQFYVIELTPKIVDQVLLRHHDEEIEVSLPDSPDEPHPMWNSMGTPNHA